MPKYFVTLDIRRDLPKNTHSGGTFFRVEKPATTPPSVNTRRISYLMLPLMPRGSSSTTQLVLRKNINTGESWYDSQMAIVGHTSRKSLAAGKSQYPRIVQLSPISVFLREANGVVLIPALRTDDNMEYGIRVLTAKCGEFNTGEVCPAVTFPKSPFFADISANIGSRGNRGQRERVGSSCC